MGGPAEAPAASIGVGPALNRTGTANGRGWPQMGKGEGGSSISNVQ